MYTYTEQRGFSLFASRCGHDRWRMIQQSGVRHSANPHSPYSPTWKHTAVLYCTVYYAVGTVRNHHPPIHFNPSAGASFPPPPNSHNTRGKLSWINYSSPSETSLDFYSPTSSYLESWFEFIRLCESFPECFPPTPQYTLDGVNHLLRNDDDD